MIVIEKHKLGGTEIELSALALGCWPMGGGYWGQSDDAESIRTIHRALELGVTLFDTAPAYGRGHSEQVLGQGLIGRRSKAIVSTKSGSSPIAAWRRDCSWARCASTRHIAPMISAHATCCGSQRIMPSACLYTAERLRPVAEELGVSLARLALRWLICQPGVTSALIGARARRDHKRCRRAGVDAARRGYDGDPGDLGRDLCVDALLLRYVGKLAHLKPVRAAARKRWRVSDESPSQSYTVEIRS